MLPYWAAQVLGAISGAGILYVIASGAAASTRRGLRLERLRRTFAGRLRAGARAAIAEVVMTFMFLLIILGATGKNARPPASRRSRSALP